MGGRQKTTLFITPEKTTSEEEGKSKVKKQPSKGKK